MTKDNDLRSDSDSIVGKIENQLADILAKKKEDVTRSLEAKIQKEQEEAQRRIELIEKEYQDEKEGLSTYQTLFAELETQRAQLKSQIKDHLTKATSYQDEIVALTGKTLEELKTVSEINEQMEQFKNDAEGRLSSVQNNMEDKYGIAASITDESQAEEINFDLDQELNKLTKIKEILSNEQVQESGSVEMKQAEPAIIPPHLETIEPTPQILQSFESTPQEEVEAQPQIESEMEIQVKEPEFTPNIKETQEAVADFTFNTETEKIPLEELKMEMETGIENKPEFIPSVITDESPVEPEERDLPPVVEPASTAIPEVIETLPEIKIEPSAIEFVSEEQKFVPEEAGPIQETVSPPEIEVAPMTPPVLPVEEKQEINNIQADGNFELVFEELEKYRKGNCSDDNGEVSYFQKNGRIIVDGECLVSTLTNSLEGAKKLYSKLTETESPKEQFFIKQDIIRYQEVLRKLMLLAIRMCEKESSSLPRFTLEILNVDILRNILEKVSMENWSDQNDFSSFDDYANSLKDAYYARITPPAIYIKSIIEELQSS